MSSLAARFPIQAFNADKVGVFLSVLCAIHCAITPVLLLLAPAFGGIWAHPASHWLVALAVIPLAGISIFRGYVNHGRNWIPVWGILGMTLILVGAVLPYLENNDGPTATAIDDTVHPTEGDAFVFVVGQDDVNPPAAIEAPCEDSCCPSLVIDEHGKTRLHIPPASIVTTLGGILLIITHIGNLCSCASCGCPSTRPS